MIAHEMRANAEVGGEAQIIEEIPVARVRRGDDDEASRRGHLAHRGPAPAAIEAQHPGAHQPGEPARGVGFDLLTRLSSTALRLRETHTATQRKRKRMSCIDAFSTLET